MIELPQVKCQDCGFLALREGHPTSLPVEPVNEEIRDGGLIRADKFYPSPFCCLCALDIHREHYDRMNRGEQQAPAFVAVIGAERECEQFFKWVPAFSPKEHVHMRFDHSIRENAERRQKEEDDRKDREHRDRWNQWILTTVCTLVIGISVFLMNYQKAQNPPVIHVHPAAQQPAEPTIIRVEPAQPIIHVNTGERK